MSDLIKKRDAIEALNVIDVYGDGIGFEVLSHAIRDVSLLPTVDAEQVRHGKWVDPEAKRPWFRHHIFKCSVCGNTLDMDGVNAGRGDANYCPNCGAKMDGKTDDTY